MATQGSAGKLLTSAVVLCATTATIVRSGHLSKRDSCLTIHDRDCCCCSAMSSITFTFTLSASSRAQQAGRPPDFNGTGTPCRAT